MTLVSSDDDLDWEFAFDSRLGHPTGSFGGANGEEEMSSAVENRPYSGPGSELTAACPVL